MSRNYRDRRALRLVTTGMVLTLGLLAASMVVDSWVHWLLSAAAVVVAFIFLFAIPWDKREQS